ncbi:MAG: Flp pilus assembly complex ATPase component [Deltaproteobacteria bacterium]|nr:Flp pilus assembly complex ATPase component [Deltaproteobacteria bacterium]
MTPKELLEKTAIFSSLPASHIAQIASRLKRLSFTKGTDLVTQGQAGDALYLIESGQVGVYVKDSDFGLGIEIAQLGPGDCLGELAMITGAKRNATCTALNDTVAHKLDRAVFDAILQQSPAVQLDMMKVLASRLSSVGSKQNIPFISLGRYQPDPQLLAMVPQQIIQRHSMAPIAYEDGSIIVAAVDPSNLNAFNEIRGFLRGMNVKPVAVSREDLERFTERQTTIPQASPRVSRTGSPEIRFLTDIDDSDRIGQISGPEVLQMVNRIIYTGIKGGASDIHIEPGRDGTRIRFRIHGSLEEPMEKIPIEAHKPLISRFKVLAKLDITETRKPQEGRISLELGDRSVDLRLSLIPTKLGQKLVMRILDASTALVPLEELVLAEKVRQAVRKMFYAPYGVVLITGPTGSGKTTTMYSALLERRNPEINISTVEDPVEFHLDGLSQVEVGGSLDINFATILRSFLRQDPDIILVGETRDAETAKLALQAGLTGRLVFTSFHTNDCISAVVRLFEMGMEPFALANSLVGVIHQRLVRRICPHCRSPFEYYPQIIENMRTAGVLGDKVPTLYRSKGCNRCGGLGFQGRVAALEVLVVTEKVRAAIASQAAPEEILAAATQGAFVSLPRYMHFLLQHGITVPGEALGALPRKGV